MSHWNLLGDFFSFLLIFFRNFTDYCDFESYSDPKSEWIMINSEYFFSQGTESYSESYMKEEQINSRRARIRRK